PRLSAKGWAMVPTWERTPAEASMAGMDQISLAIGFGFVTASVLALASVGLTLQFGVTNYVNFAYGGFLTLGAYVAWELTTVLGVNLWLAMLAAGVAVGLAGVAISRGILDHFTRGKRNLFYLLIVTFGLSLIIQNVVEAIWGAGYVKFSLPPEKPLNLGPFLLSSRELIIIGVAIVAMILVHLLLTYTKLGKAMRAMSDNTSLAMVTGVNTDSVTTVTWFISGVLAGLAGAVFGYDITSVVPSSGLIYLFVIFAAVILGGIGKPYGAMIGAVVIGLATEVSAVFINPSYKNDVAFAILAIVLLIRPQGLFAVAGKV
ncbi:MAG: branched-chain amino acid ABC transporter permease, partial [Acidimicrobiales bacterium]